MRFRKLILAVLAAVLLACSARAEELEIELSVDGVQSLKYKGVEYCEPSGHGRLGFADGPRYGNQWEPCVIDENKSKDPFPTEAIGSKFEDDTVTQTYPWGTLSARYVVDGADLNVTATITNTSETPIRWWKANLLQLNDRLVFDTRKWQQVMPYGYTQNMHWDYHWFMWGMKGNPYSHWNFTDPHVYWWVDKAAPFDAEPVKIFFADLDPQWQTGVYRVKTEKSYAWPVRAAADGDPGSEKLKIPTGGSDTVHVSIRFRPASAKAVEVCGDAYEAFGRAYPRTATWTDRRPIGCYFGCRGNNLGGTNTNGWFNDKTVDIDSPAGREEFARKLLEEIDRTIEVLKAVDAQGVIWWDIEGARNPHPITYIGDPRVLDPEHPLHEKFVPELDTIVEYKGEKMKVVDACFKKWQDAGLETGVTIRPQRIALQGDKFKQVSDGKEFGGNLRDKAVYARERWDCRIFYVDSISEWFGNWWLEPTVKKYDDILLLPEWARTRSYRHSSQFSHTKFTHFVRGVPDYFQACWPDAFCCMTHYPFEKNMDNATYAVSRGNLFLFNCWYNSKESKFIKEIYAKTGTRHAPLAADQELKAKPGAEITVTLKASDEDGEELTYALLGPADHGTVTVDAAGKATYKAPEGFTGEDVFTFVATDASGLKSNRGFVKIEVE